ncbi:MAG: hypothetical protein ACRDPV_10215 [Gaiellaceae bacterium]
MGRKSHRQISETEFEGFSDYESAESHANLEEAIDEAMFAARELGGHGDDDLLWDVEIRVTLRGANQNVKSYSAKTTKSDQPGR